MKGQPRGFLPTTEFWARKDRPNVIRAARMLASVTAVVLASILTVAATGDGVKLSKMILAVCAYFTLRQVLLGIAEKILRAAVFGVRRT